VAIPLEVFPTGWFQIGWSAEIAPGAVTPLRYFGEDLVAFRSTDGRLAVLDAHCPHLGAHLGHGGKVSGDCVRCPYHGWEWDLEGVNTRIPYQEQPVNKRLRKWATIERHGMIFGWFEPTGGEPRWPLPNLFADFEGMEAPESDFYPCYPDAVVNKPGEPFAVQLMMENSADCTHFKYAHGTPETPELLNFGEKGAWWCGEIGFRSPRTKEIALRLYSVRPNVGLVFTYYNGRSPYRLILAGTPVDQGVSHVRVSYFLPRAPGSRDVMPEDLREFARGADELYEQDARLWRHQRFEQRPVFAAQDVAGYSSFRRWSEQFYVKA